MAAFPSPINVHSRNDDIGLADNKGIALQDGDLHVWYFFTSNILERDLFARYGAELSNQELNRYYSFKFARDSCKYLTSRILLRNALSSYCRTLPSDWEFCHARYGKPYLRPAPSQYRLKFNLSRTNDLSAIVISAGREVGIDVEDIRSIDDPMPVATEAFSSVEIEELLRLEPGLRRQVFLEDWTLKEAYLKARGIGLSGSLEEVSWDRSDGKRTLQFNGNKSDCVNWRALLEFPSVEHVCCVAAEFTHDRDLRFKSRNFYPDL